MNLRKDRSLDELAASGNVAQFVSFAPTPERHPKQTYSRISRLVPNQSFASHGDAILTLLENSPDHSINLRSFTPDNPRSREFLYGITDVHNAISELERLIAEGLYVIANETVDISDGGVSGVVEAGVIEFSPDDTPRCVEKSGTASLLTEDGLSVLSKVYGFRPELPEVVGHRIEFSVHPKPRGYKNTHTLIWEYEAVSTRAQNPNISWPNNFSQLLGDKAFGLLIADAMGMAVPRSTVISRRVPPFSFGQETGSLETWLRTCPTEQVPGRYTTTPYWIDPFELLSREDPNHKVIASVISQSAVPAVFSGAAITRRDGRLQVEGTQGSGEDFMLGRTAAQSLPEQIVSDILDVNQALRNRLGAVRFEWVHDGTRPWVVQLHRGRTVSTKTVLVPGEANKWTRFETDLGLESLRDRLERLAPDVGVILVGNVGLTSHLADLARKSGRPTKIIRKTNSPQQFLFEMQEGDDDDV